MSRRFAAGLSPITYHLSPPPLRVHSRFFFLVVRRKHASIRDEYTSKDIQNRRRPGSKSARVWRDATHRQRQLHRIDPKVPVEESLGAMAKLQHQGKIRHIGLSEVKPAEIDRARKVVDIVSIQNRYNVGDRDMKMY
jgi:hypothetical protein